MNIKLLLTSCLLGGISILPIAAQTPCNNGYAGNYSCHNVDLLSRLTVEQLGAEEFNGVWVNDIWGWTDPETGKEYALVGMANGTSFVDVTDPVNPIVIGILPEHHSAESARKSNFKQAASPMHDFGKSVWRDIKVYKDHAFVVADADSGHGMQIFDLTQLRNYSGERIEFPETAHYNGISSAHNIVINEESGFAYVVGANDGNHTCSLGGLHIVNIQNPTSPVYAGCFDNDGYTHDAQVVIYNGPDTDYVGKEIAFAANEETVTVVDVSSKSNPQMLARKGYSTAGYTHQGWLTPDHKYFIANDELDEYYGIVAKTRSYIWDVQNLNNPRLIGEYSGPYNTIDHNLYTRDKYVFEANYTSGLRILDTENIKNGILTEAAFFDTYPSGNGVSFDGAWSNYPYLASGNILVSDIQGGLFVLKPSMSFPVTISGDLSKCPGGEATFSTYSSSIKSYQWQIAANGESYNDLQNNDTYAGVNTFRLFIGDITKDLIGAKYRLKATLVNGAIEYSNSSSLLINEGELPTTEFSYAATDNVVDFFASAETQATTEAYYWNFGDGSFSKEQEPSHTYTEAGQFEVTLTTTNACGENTSTQIITIDESALGFEDEFQQDISLFPNPSAGNFSVKSGKQLNRIKKVLVYNTNGKLLHSQQFTVAASEQEVEANTLAPGYYLVKIITDKTSVVRPILKR
jgi:choice-of-anchor B domain-containing protein